jgi:hypothetical protein
MDVSRNRHRQTSISTDIDKVQQQASGGKLTTPAIRPPAPVGRWSQRLHREPWGDERSSLMRIRIGWIAAALYLLLPSAVHAQASITGVVKDSSGSILPGVTVPRTVVVAVRHGHQQPLYWLDRLDDVK